MKNTVIIKMLSIFAFFVFSCTPKCDIKNIMKPDDIQIDWENYNDVYNIFWHYFSNNCRGAGNLTSDIIKVHGKIDISSFHFVRNYPDKSTYLHSFELIDEQEHEYNSIYDYLYNRYDYRAFSVRVFCYNIADELQKKLESCDLTRKCYIKGEVSTGILGGGRSEGYNDDCCFTFPSVNLYNIDDIFFETNKIDSDE